jgi:hypothetical protein
MGLFQGICNIYNPQKMSSVSPKVKVVDTQNGHFNGEDYDQSWDFGVPYFQRTILQTQPFLVVNSSSGAIGWGFLL